MMRTVGVSDMAISRSPEETLITYSLGSCVGLSLARERKPFRPEAIKALVAQILGGENG